MTTHDDDVMMVTYAAAADDDDDDEMIEYSDDGIHWMTVRRSMIDPLTRRLRQAPATDVTSSGVDVNALTSSVVGVAADKSADVHVTDDTVTDDAANASLEELDDDTVVVPRVADIISKIESTRLQQDASTAHEGCRRSSQSSPPPSPLLREGGIVSSHAWSSVMQSEKDILSQLTYVLKDRRSQFLEWEKLNK